MLLPTFLGTALQGSYCKTVHGDDFSRHNLPAKAGRLCLEKSVKSIALTTCRGAAVRQSMAMDCLTAAPRQVVKAIDFTDFSRHNLPALAGRLCLEKSSPWTVLQ
jgi:hypothetical protein